MSSSNYQPPLMSVGSVVSAAASAQLSTVELELAKIKKTQGIESPAAAAARRQQEEAAMKRDTRIGSVVASFAIAVGLVAMWIEASLIVYIAFVFPLFTAPYVVVQRRQLSRLPTFREEHNNLRYTIREIQVENTQLAALQTKVEIEVSRLGDAEGRLGTIAEQQGADVNQLQGLVQENGQILRELKALNESAVVADILKAIIASDRSRNLVIDEKEMEGLLCRLRAIKAVRNVDPVEMRSAFASADSMSLRNVIHITKELLEQDQLQIVRNAEKHKAIIKKKAPETKLPVVKEGAAYSAFLV